MFLFWTSPVLIILLMSSLLTGYAASASNSDSAAAPTAVRVLDWEIQYKSPAGSINATPEFDNFSVQLRQTNLITGAQTGDEVTSFSGSFLSFLPLILKFPVIIPYPSIDAFGPIMDPPVPLQSLGISASTPPNTPIVDPPTPAPTSTPTVPPGSTDTPTPPPGSTDTPTPTVTPKPSLTPTNMPTATREIAEDGDFEDNRGSWKEFSLLEYDLILGENEGDPQAPGGAYSGSWYVWLGGDNSEISYIERQFTVPDPDKGEYRRYFLGHRIQRQSYDSVCATDLYPTSSFPSPKDRDEFLAGHLRHATSGTLDKLGIDLGGMIVCVNESDRSGCSDSAVKSFGGQKMVYVSYYDLCTVADGTGWYVFLFPIDPLAGFPGPTLYGENITVQIKTVADSQLASSILVDNVAWWEGPLLPTPTPSTASVQNNNPGIQIASPLLVSDTPPELSGARFVVDAAGQKKVDYPMLSTSPDAFLKQRQLK